MTITIETDGLDEVKDLINKVPFWSYNGVKKALSEYVLAVDTSIKLQLTGVDLNVRTGNLRRSFGFEVHGQSPFLNTLGASNYTKAIYAPIHQYGGTIRAKNKYMMLPGGPYLNIPTSYNQTRSGVQRMTAYQVFEEGGWIQKTGPTKKSPFVVMLDGVPMFALRKSVEIPKRMHFIETVEKGLPTLLSDIGKFAIEEADKI